MVRNAIERLDAADQLVSLIARAINLGHPESIRMSRIGLGDLLDLNDGQINVLTSRLESWLATHQGAIAAPVAAS